MPEVEVEALRDIARHNPTETLIVGQRRMTLHYIQFMDRFSVEPLPGTLFERLGDGRHRRLAENLERQLNGGWHFSAGSRNIYGTGPFCSVCAGKDQRHSTGQN